MTFKEYLEMKLMESQAVKPIREAELPPDPCTVLRRSGIKIQASIPHKDWYEIILFTDPASLPLEKILSGFDYKVKDGKLYVRYMEV